MARTYRAFCVVGFPPTVTPVGLGELGRSYDGTADIALKDTLPHHEEPTEQTGDEKCNAQAKEKRVSKDARGTYQTGLGCV